MAKRLGAGWYVKDGNDVAIVHFVDRVAGIYRTAKNGPDKRTADAVVVLMYDRNGWHEPAPGEV